MTTFLLIRHGLNDMVGHAIAGRRDGVHLNETGRAQAHALAERLSREPIAALYSSPLDRTRETAEPLAERLGLEVQIAPEIIEVGYGDWTGKALGELTPDPLWRHYNRFRSGTRVPGGELMLEIQARAVGFLLSLRSEWDGRTVALVSHGDVIRSCVAYFLGMPLDLMLRFEVEPASVSALELYDDGAKLLYLNRTL